MQAIAARAPKRFIESQLSLTAQAFGYEGGWGIERRAKKDSFRELVASIAPYRCAGPGCTRMVRWRSGLGGYCSGSCRMRGYKARMTPEERARFRARRAAHARARRAAYGPEDKARAVESTRKWRDEHRERSREYFRRYDRARNETQARIEQRRRWRERSRRQLEGLGKDSA